MLAARAFAADRSGCGSGQLHDLHEAAARYARAGALGRVSRSAGAGDLVVPDRGTRAVQGVLRFRGGGACGDAICVARGSTRICARRRRSAPSAGSTILVVSTSLGDDSIELANTVIHELTHNTYWAGRSGGIQRVVREFCGYRAARSSSSARAVTRHCARRGWRRGGPNEQTLGAFWTAGVRSAGFGVSGPSGDDSVGRAIDSRRGTRSFATARDSLTTSLPQRLRHDSARGARPCATRQRGATGAADLSDGLDGSTRCTRPMARPAGQRCSGSSRSRGEMRRSIRVCNLGQIQRWVLEAVVTRIQMGGRESRPT